MTPLALTALTLAGLSPWLLESGPLAGQEKGPKAQQASEEAADPDEAKTIWEYLSSRYDTNGDGKIDKKEYTRGSTQFDRLDKDKNGFIDADDTAQAGGRGGERGGRRGGGGGAGRGGRGGSQQSAPTEGSRAPGFELETLYPAKEIESEKKGDAKESKKEAEKEPKFKSVSLKSFEGKKPVALIFGSYT